MKSFAPFKIVLICFVMVILEGITTRFTLPFTNDGQAVFHFLFIFLVMVTIFFERSHTYYVILFSLIFSIMIDILYTGVLGVYLFSYSITLYIIRIFMKVFHSNFFVVLLMLLIGIALTDHIVYFLYKIILVHDMPWDAFITERFIPTLAWNVIFGIIFYLLFAKRLEKWSFQRFEEKK